VLVDDVVESKESGGQTTESRHKRTPQEMKQIEDLAKAALGFDTGRGDQISVQNITFQSSPVEKLDAPTFTERVRVVSERWTGMLRYVALLALFMFVYFLILNPVKKQVLSAFDSAKPALPAGMVTAESQAREQLAGDQAFLGPSTATAAPVQRALAMRQQVVSTVKADPEGAGQLVKSWLGESGAS
jgi:flagellar M-ring protein FliF